MMKTHGSGLFKDSDFKHLGKNVIMENGVLVFHPENITVEDDIYIGHQTILKGYYNNTIEIRSGTWIGQQCFFHGAGGLSIGRHVGIGPGVKIITSYHNDQTVENPILYSPLIFARVVIEDDCDLGVGSIILPGVTVGKGAVVGAGAVVTKNVSSFTVVAGVPAKVLRKREKK